MGVKRAGTKGTKGFRPKPPIGHSLKTNKKDGYDRKIKYWTGVYNKGYKENDPALMLSAMDSLMFFTKKRCELIEKGEI